MLKLPLLRMKKKRSHSRAQWLTFAPILSPTILCGSHWMCKVEMPHPRAYPVNTKKPTCFGWGAAFRWMLFDWVPHMVVDCHCVNPKGKKTTLTSWTWMNPNHLSSKCIIYQSSTLINPTIIISPTAISLSNAALVWRVACRPRLSRHRGRRMVVTQRCWSYESIRLNYGTIRWI